MPALALPRPFTDCHASPTPTLAFIVNSVRSFGSSTCLPLTNGFSMPRAHDSLNVPGDRLFAMSFSSTFVFRVLLSVQNSSRPIDMRNFYCPPFY